MMTAQQPQHISVMLEQCIDLLSPALRHDGAVYVDATLGLGGHAARVLEAAPQARLIGIDRDAEAIAIAQERLREYADRVTIVHAANDALGAVVASAAPTGIDAILFDLGVSSLQLDESERGFSYMQDAALDMRMDVSEELTAAQLVNSSDADTLAALFRKYGDEKYARPIARAIVERRVNSPIETTGELVEIIESAVPRSVRFGKGHSAKRVFQALRIAVNDELGMLTRALPQALDALTVGGRAVILSFQSDEDRIVKRIVRAATADRTPQGLPSQLPEYAPVFRNLVHGAIRPSAAEVHENSRAASVRLRAVEKRRAAASATYLTDAIRGESV